MDEKAVKNNKNDRGVDKTDSGVKSMKSDNASISSWSKLYEHKKAASTRVQKKTADEDLPEKRAHTTPGFFSSTS